MKKILLFLSLITSMNVLANDVVIKTNSKVIKELNEDFTTYVVKYKENIDKRKIETFLKKWVDKYYFTVDGTEVNDFTYQTKVRLSEIYIGFMGVIVLVLIFISVVFIIISLSILSCSLATCCSISGFSKQVLIRLL